MATVTQMKPFDHDATQEKVRHPLHRMRKYIRRYVFLEGAALILLFAAILFWLGLAFDFGLYCLNIPAINVFGIDWVLELNDLDPTGRSSLGIRILILSAIVIGLLALGFTKVVTRWFREFNDRALALVLERRFPKELGDRLITAVELHDPKMAAKYGYSQAMVEKTILDGVERLKALPVADVFDWRRLYRLWFLVALSTVGVWLVVFAVCCGASYAGMHIARARGEAEREEQAAQDVKGDGLILAAPGKDETEWLDPYRFCWKFYDVADTWTERNVLMQNTYWPRHAFLEIGRFQPSQDNPNEMRVARDDVRPDLQVRAYEWVIADRDRVKAPHGWRALAWHDLVERKLIEPELAARVKIPADFADWQIDPDELEPNLVTALFDTATQERPSGELRRHFQEPNVARKIQERGAQADLNALLDWRTWKMDKLFAQVNKLKESRVRIKLRELNQGADLAALDEILSRLEDSAAAPNMARTLRKLNVPREVEVSFRGEETSFGETKPLEPGNKYTISLDRLRDSTRFRLRIRGDDHFTQPKTIVLVAAPSPAGITIDKDEPAYIYHRLEGVDQMALRGAKHLTRAMPLSTTGDTNTIEVPLGTRLVIHVKTDRNLRPEKAVFTRDNAVLPEGYDHFRGQIEPDADRGGFALVMDNLTRKHEFSIDYFDEDNIRGRRRFKIIALIDSEPQMGNLAVLGLTLRKPKFKAPEKGREGDTRDLAELMNSYLITPDAIIPFECSVRDDYGLVRVGYQFKYRVEDVDLVAQASGKKIAAADGDVVGRRTGLIVSNFQFWPGNPQSYLFGPHFLGWTAQRLEQELRDTQHYVEGYADAEGFEEMRKRKPRIRAADIKTALTKKSTATPWEFDFKDDRTERGELGFDLRVHLRELRSVNVDQFGQTHYSLKIAVQATDNNVETGAPYTIVSGAEPNQKTLNLRGNTKRNKNGFVSFLIVSENELLAQIALEEQQIFEKLEAAKNKVDDGIVSLSQQQAKVVGDENVDMENVLNRMNEIRTALGSAKNNMQDSLQAYRNIRQELTINRVRAARKTKIENSILEPLDFMVNALPFPGSGSLPNAEEALAAAQAQVERDVNANQRSAPLVHRKNMSEADRALMKLSNDLKLVLDAMSEGLSEAAAIAILAAIEQRQNRNTKLLQDMHKKAVIDLIEKQLNPSKDEPKKDKKTSQLDPRGLPGSARNAVAMFPGEPNPVRGRLNATAIERAGRRSDGCS